MINQNKQEMLDAYSIVGLFILSYDWLSDGPIFQLFGDVSS